MKALPFYATAGYSVEDYDFSLPGVPGYRMSLKGLSLLCPPVAAVTGLASLQIANLVSGPGQAAYGTAPDGNALTLFFLPSTTQPVSLSDSFLDDVVVTPGFPGPLVTPVPMQFNINPHGSDNLSAVVVSAWGLYLPVED